jgi:hypothetical protein
MKRIHLLAVLLAAAPATTSMSQEEPAPTASQFFARGSSPESELSARYPELAIAAAEGAVRGNPALAREVSAAVLAAAPGTDQSDLATAVADAASLEYTAVLGWFSDPLGMSSLPTSAFPGGGGSSRPRPYSD